MARTAKQGLSHHATKGFRLSIGKKPDGNYKTFWLGRERLLAEYHANTLRGQFQNMQLQDREVWTEDDEASVKWYVDHFRAMQIGLRERQAADVRQVQLTGQFLNAVIIGDPVSPRAKRQSSEDPAIQPKLTLHSAIDAYVEAFEKKVLTEGHKERTRQLLNDLKHFRGDVPLAEIDRVWLQTLTDQIKSRPKSRKRKTRLAPYTVRNMLRSWSRFIDWLDANADSARFGRWEAPRRWEDLFQVHLTKLMSKAERDAHADGPKHLTLEQVIRLYRAARNDLHRICVVLGTFAALGQKEIASLRRDEFHLTSGTLTHRRSKTGQLGKFWLPPEAVTLIRGYFRKVRTDKGNTAFFTADGSLLVTDSSDAVRQAWTDIVDRVNKEDGKKIEKCVQGFYALRKFAADFAMRQGGPVVRDTFLAHAPESIGAKHYSNTRDFDCVFQVGRTLYAQMKAAGAFDITQPKKEVGPSFASPRKRSRKEDAERPQSDGFQKTSTQIIDAAA